MALIIELRSKGFLAEMLPTRNDRTNWRSRARVNLTKGKIDRGSTVTVEADDNYPIVRYFAVIINTDAFPDHPVIAALVHGFAHRVLWEHIESGQKKSITRDGHEFLISRI